MNRLTCAYLCFWLVCSAAAQATTIFDAVDRGDVPAIKSILKANPRCIDARDDTGSTTLHRCAYVRSRKAGEYAAIVELLISKGAKVNARANNGDTPLHTAAFRSHSSVARVLISRGADLNAKCCDGQTPLHYAVYDFIDDYSDCTKLLIAKGAKVNAQDDQGRTPLRLALDRQNDYAARILRQHGGVAKQKTVSIRFNGAAKPVSGDWVCESRRISIKGKPFTDWAWPGVSGRAVFDLRSLIGARYFSVYAGVTDAKPGESYSARIDLDGRKATGVTMRYGQAPKLLRVDLAGHRTMTIYGTGQGVYADPHLIKLE